nr:uncharacterized protein LOC109181161 [Ipomoea batatas]
MFKSELKLSFPRLHDGGYDIYKILCHLITASNLFMIIKDPLKEPINDFGHDLHSSSQSLKVKDTKKRKIIPKICSNPQIDTNPFLIFKATDERNTLFRSILTNSSTLSPFCKEQVLATLLQNQELLDDLSTKESRNLLALAQGIRATPWPIEESDDEVNEADLQAALEASKKADNVVPFSSSGTVSLHRLFLNSHFDDCSAIKSVVVSHEESVPSNLPCVSVDFADVRARVLSTHSILTSLKSTVVRMEKVLLDDKKLLQSFEAGDVGSDSAPAR